MNTFTSLKFVTAIAVIGGTAFGATPAARPVWTDRQAPGASSVVCPCADGGAIRIDALSDRLFRIRRNPAGRKEWTESGLNRYGVLARDWPAPAGLARTPTGCETPAARIAADASTGAVTVRSKVSDAGFTVATRLAGKGFEMSFPLADGERIYGLGDVSRDNIQRRPGRYEIWVKNVNSYIPIPMAISRRGWGMLLNTTWRHVIDVGQTKKDAMVCTAGEGDLDAYVFVGRDYRDLLDTYTRLTGRPALLPAFGFGFSYVCNQNIDEYALMGEARTFRDRDLPCDVIGLEPGWMSKFYDYSTRKWWDNDKFHFPYWAPKGGHTWIAALNRLGFKLSLWLCVDYDLFRYEEECVRGRSGTADRKSADGGDVTETWLDDRVADPTFAKDEKERYMRNVAKKLPFRERLVEEGASPWFEHLKKFVEQGAQCFKLDASNQATEHPKRAWANGKTDEEMHNLYPLVYAKQMACGYTNYTARRAMVYSSCGYAGLQQYVATWAGDTGGGPKPCASLLNLGMSGHPYQSCDLAVESPESLHFGFLQTWSQQNNWDYWKQPWLQEPEKEATVRKYIRLRYRLIPYIYTAAAEAARTGWPVMRALPFAYPDDPAYDECRTTYMLGDNLLVGAFTDTVTLPPGVWHEWESGVTVRGPTRRPVRTRADWGGALYVKAGAIIPTWPVRSHVSAGWSNAVAFEVWPSADGTAELYEDDGLTLDYRRGAYAQIPLKVARAADGTVTFTVGRRHGTEKATFRTPGKPDYSAVFHLDAPPAQVTLDGRAVTGRWDAQRGTFTVRLGAVPVTGCTVCLKPPAFPALTLKTAAGSCTVDLFGARITSLTLGGDDILWNADPVQHTAADWAHGGLPICWPYLGRRPGEPIHGTLWRTPFRVVSRTEGAARSELVLAPEICPLDVEYRITLTDRLSLTLVTKNRTSAEMPFSVGFHPYFRVNERDRTEISGLVDRPMKVTAAIDTGFPIAATEQTVRLAEGARTLVLKAKGFPRINVWNPGAEKDCPGALPDGAEHRFLSVEPYVRQGTMTLAPGETHVGTFEISR